LEQKKWEPWGYCVVGLASDNARPEETVRNLTAAGAVNEVADEADRVLLLLLELFVEVEEDVGGFDDEEEEEEDVAVLGLECLIVDGLAEEDAEGEGARMSSNSPNISSISLFMIAYYDPVLNFWARLPNHSYSLLVYHTRTEAHGFVLVSI
jgi:hypothetical protein